MDSNITINIVEPGSSTPVDPVVPNTGLFTHGIGGPEATILGITAAVIILAVVAAVLYYRNKKQGKFISLKHKKSTAIGLASLAAVVSLGTLAGLLKLGANAIDAEAQANEETNETAEATDGELTIELGDEPVFRWIESTVTVTEDMPAGYTLKAYSENSTLSAEGTDKTISMVTIPEDGLENAGSLATALTDNTWGLAVEQPESEEQEIYFSLPATAEEAVTIATVEDMEAEGSDTVTVYYGVYITPDMPYGTYTGASVNYEVEDNSLATVIFDGNELYFNGDSSQTTNTAKYAIEITENTKKYSHTPNVDDEGNKLKSISYGTTTNEVVTIPGATRLNVALVYGSYGTAYGYASLWAGSHPDYTAEGDYTTGIQNCEGSSVTDGKFGGGGSESTTTAQCTINDDTVTLAYWAQPGGGPSIGYGYYATVTGYDADGNLIYLPENQLASGEYLIPGSSSSTYYRFIGWDKNSEATTPTYTNEEDIAKGLALVPGASTTLYAIWEPAFTISYNGNGADAAINMDNVEQYTTDITAESKTVDLIASNFTKEGYGFAGWSTDANAWEHLTDEITTNDPTIYGPNQTITVNPATSTKLALYAVWVPAAQSNGSPVYLQNWTGCSNLTATTYSDSALTVGKNTITALTDARDGNVYTVARLADGNCWTVENLRLDDKATIATTNTNNPVVEPDTTNVAIKNNDGNTSNHLSPTNNSWCTSGDAECLDQSNLNTNNTVLTAASPTFSQDFTSEAHNWQTGSLDANITSYGNYYNWYSATAGNGKQATASGVTAGDVCPTGWHLPYGGSGTGEKGGNTNGGFYYLNQQMGGNTSSQDSNNWRSFPNNFVYSGGWNGSSAGDRGNGGCYWSSTAGNTSSAYGLYLGSGGVYPDSSSSKNSGYSARCLAPGQ